MIHGADDEEVPVSQALVFAAKLSGLQKVEFDRVREGDPRGAQQSPRSRCAIVACSTIPTKNCCAAYAAFTTVILDAFEGAGRLRGLGPHRGHRESAAAVRPGIRRRKPA